MKRKLHLLLTLLLLAVCATGGGRNNSYLYSSKHFICYLN